MHTGCCSTNSKALLQRYEDAAVLAQGGSGSSTGILAGGHEDAAAAERDAAAGQKASQAFCAPALAQKDRQGAELELLQASVALKCAGVYRV